MLVIKLPPNGVVGYNKVELHSTIKVQLGERALKRDKYVCFFHGCEELKLACRVMKWRRRRNNATQQNNGFFSAFFAGFMMAHVTAAALGNFIFLFILICFVYFSVFRQQELLLSLKPGLHLISSLIRYSINCRYLIPWIQHWYIIIY